MIIIFIISKANIAKTNYITKMNTKIGVIISIAINARMLKTIQMIQSEMFDTIMKNKNGEKITYNGKVITFHPTHIGHSSNVKGRNKMFRSQSRGGKKNQFRGQKFHIILTS